MSTKPKQDEVIVCAAIKIGDEVSLCIRHFDNFTRKAFLDESSADRRCVQGFVTNRGRFLNREEALHLSLKNGQVDMRKKVGFKGELFSEDLY